MPQDFKTIIYSLHPLERTVLPYLSEKSISEIAKKTNLVESEVWTALQLLEQKGYVKIEKTQTPLICLDSFGQRFLEEELPEYQVLKELNGKETRLSSLSLAQDVIGSALGELKKHQLVETRKEDELILTPTEKGIEFLEKYTNPLIKFKDGVEESALDTTEYEQIRKRKGFLKKETKKTFSFELTNEGDKLVEEFTKNYSNIDLVETLTTDMLKNSSWKGREFRYYDVELQTTPLAMGRVHPMLEANDILSQVFLEMGFKEMKGPLVESAFWNMDVMWIPQDHPARDEQDTFYVEGSTELPDKLKENVKTMHEKGIRQTHTPKGDFSYDVSSKKLLRTHSTATTFRLLQDLGERYAKGENVDGKYFYLANVFRNEAVDATHLAEFYQGEGFIIGDNLSLAHLMGFVKEYLEKLGYEDIHFKPTFNPYTEPSMEAHIYDEKIGKSYALINSGIFRPETLEPMGLGDKTIIAWGFGASRIAAKLAGKESMREITGATCDFGWLQHRSMMKRKISQGGKK